MYTYSGRPINNTENISVNYIYDEIGESFYYLTRINQTKIDGTKQYPFVRFPTTGETYTPQTLRQVEGWDLIINGGWYMLQIENSQVIRCSHDTRPEQMALTINQNGELGYLASWENDDGKNLVNSGIVSAMSNFFPIVVDYEAFDYPVSEDMQTDAWRYAQRQIIGQYGNGDYAIITSEGRGYNNSKGLTIDRCIDICKGLGLKFAYNGDGGGSTQTMIGKKRLNNIYEGTDGRLVHGFLVFNGTDQFAIPEP